ncbi:MAG: VWA domain-containing protein [Thermomicrobiales bacterium]
MAQVLSTSFHIQAEWDRTMVPVEGGTAILVAEIQVARPVTSEVNRPAIDLAFVLDRSGSMSGQPLEMVKQAVKVALTYLNEQDRVALVSFDHGVRIWHGLEYATGPQKALTRMAVDAIREGGSTDLAGGWMSGCDVMQRMMYSAAPRVRRVVVLTDGQANVGITEPAEFSEMATRFRRQGIATSTIGVGLHFDETLLTATAEAGGGNFTYADDAAKLPAFFEREIGDLSKVVAMAPQLVLTLEPGVHGSLLNAFPTRVEGASMLIDLRDLIEGDELVLVFEVEVPAGAEHSVVAMTGALRLTDSTQVPIEIPTLQRRLRSEVEVHPQAPRVAQRHAMERTSTMRREAMRLDRQGDVMSSRRTLRDAHSMLYAAPQSAEIAEMMQDVESLADTQAVFSEAVRKQEAHTGHNRSRGRRS